ncbi:3'-5' exonuclease [Halomonas sp.]|uniref:3'-5' exonuclease n=1 Tax=Halomonas sp. TaxID=1486246 RepID=UPI003562ED74
MAINVQTTGLDARHADLVSIAAVRLRGERLRLSESLDLRLARPASLTAESIRRHGLRGIDLEDGLPVGLALAQLLDFIGNRPLVGWRLGHALESLNRELRPRFGFDLPNAGIDIRHNYVRQLRRRHPEIEPILRFDEVARTLDVSMTDCRTPLGVAVTTALMYLRLTRGAMLASERGGSIAGKQAGW